MTDRQIEFINRLYLVNDGLWIYFLIRRGKYSLISASSYLCLTPPTLTLRPLPPTFLH